MVRHGETEWTRNSRQTGRADFPLTSEGIEEARALARILDAFGANPLTLDGIYCSPARRARETLEAILPLGIVGTSSELLREIDFGDVEGMTPGEVEAAIPGWDVWTMGCPGGESVEDLGKRADAFLADCQDGEDILAVTHGLMLRVLAMRALGFEPRQGGRFSVATASLSIVEDGYRGRVMTHWNVKRPRFLPEARHM